MRRRTLLQAGGGAAATALSGCVSTLPFGADTGRDPVWSAPRGDVVDVDSFHGWVYTQSSDGEPVIAAHDPADGSREWACQQCLDAHFTDDRFYLQGYGDDPTVTAYSSPVRTEWTALGRFTTVDDTHAYLLDDIATDTQDGYSVLRAVDVVTGTVQWVQVFEYRASTTPSTQRGDDLYTVIDRPMGQPLQAYRIDPSTGRRLWRHQLPDGILPETARHGTTLYVGYEYATTYHAGIVAITGDGHRRWTRSWNGYLAYPVMAGKDTVLATVVLGHTYQHETVALDPGDGTTVWHYDETLVGVTDELAYLRRDNTVTVRRIDSGTPVVDLDLQTVIDDLREPVDGFAVADDTLYVTSGPRLLAIDPHEETVDWEFIADRDVTIADIHPDRVYASTSTTVAALDR